MTSEGKCLKFWVLQGSVFGPRKYCLYSKQISAVCNRHNLLCHCYADDTQVYMAFMPKTTWFDVAKKLEACLTDISTWMSANMLKLNEEKTELIIFNPKHQVRINEELWLQVCKLQNSSAKLVTRTHKREHITPVLNSLRWLPVIYRSQYKILMYTFNALQGPAPK